jgi:hypothetical protein
VQWGEGEARARHAFSVFGVGFADLLVLDACFGLTLAHDTQVQSVKLGHPTVAADADDLVHPDIEEVFEELIECVVRVAAKGT